MQVTRESLSELISRGDAVAMTAIGRALVHLLNRQTQEEAAANVTKNHNGRGFTPGDARQGSIHAKYWLKHKTLTAWQMDRWLEPDARGTLRLAKYWRQINEEAQKRAAAQVKETVK